jgi:hypothetical protein
MNRLNRDQRDTRIKMLTRQMMAINNLQSMFSRVMSQKSCGCCVLMIFYEENNNVNVNNLCQLLCEFHMIPFQKLKRKWDWDALNNSFNDGDSWEKVKKENGYEKILFLWLDGEALHLNNY